MCYTLGCLVLRIDPRHLRTRAALTALAFVLASVIGLVHTATTQHVRCAEHGELIHGDAPSDVAVAPSTDAIAHQRPESTRHGHEHCSLATALHVTAVSSPSITNVSTATTAAPVIAGALLVVSHRDLYRTAPKTSPPA